MLCPLCKVFHSYDGYSLLPIWSNKLNYCPPSFRNNHIDNKKKMEVLECSTMDFFLLSFSLSHSLYFVCLTAQLAKMYLYVSIQWLHFFYRFLSSFFRICSHWKNAWFCPILLFSVRRTLGRNVNSISGGGGGGWLCAQEETNTISNFLHFYVHRCVSFP